MGKQYEKKELKRNSPTYLCEYEVTWFTMYKRPVLDMKMQEKIAEFMSRQDTLCGAKIRYARLGENAVTLGISISPELSPHTVIQSIKKELGAYLREQYSFLKSRLPCLWSAGYLLNTIGKKPSKTDIQNFERSLPSSRITRRKSWLP